MIRMIQSKSAAQAKDYFTDALLKSDYYLDDQELNGTFQGKLAERLKITGPASKDVFFALCENRHPYTGRPLSPRTKADRTTGYDINFHCPKSVSVLHVLSKDDHILEAFKASVKQTMLDIEADSKTRVRKGGKAEDRVTGELVWVDFVHQTARPVDGFEPDPHLHAHCYVFNQTWDEEENRVKAGQFRDINRDMPYYQSLFHKRLSDNLIKLGYRIKRTEKSFEIEGVPKNVLALFSKRTNEIGQIAKEKGITDAKALDKLGATTRARKQKGLSMEDLKTEWRRQIHALEDQQQGEGNAIIRNAPVKHEYDPEFAQKCVDHAILHSFERASVVPYRRLLATAYSHGLGNPFLSAEDIEATMAKDARLIKIMDKSAEVCTTKEVLLEERRMVLLAQAGRGKMYPLYHDVPPLICTGQQAEAIRHVLTTSDRVSIIRGAAGTGKTTLMKEVDQLITKAGKELMVVAPTAQASRHVLRIEGFADSETVAKLLVDKAMQEKLKGQVLLVDEAGLLGTKDMADLLHLVTEKDARLILVGDTRQHSSVVRGDALRILNTVGEIRTAEVSRIYRQKNVEYRSAVEDLSKGNVKDAFDKLDRIGSIKQVGKLKGEVNLVEDYIGLVKKSKSALVISPTHKQGESVTNEIRDRLREEGMIGKKEISALKLVNLNMTVAEKNDWRNFEKGHRVQFNQNGKSIKRGSLWMVDSVSKDNVLIKDPTGNVISLPEKAGDKFDVFELQPMLVSKGDKIRITRNGFDTQKKRLDNGQVLNVISVNKKGDIELQNSVSHSIYTIDKDFGHLSHAHCITSYGSQGKTVDEVLISQPANTFAATDAKQFYVSVSRGRERATIYTDDKKLLLEHASQLGDRKSAIELVDNKSKHLDHVLQLQRNEHKHDPIFKDQNKTPLIKNPFNNRDDYEPSF